MKTNQISTKPMPSTLTGNGLLRDAHYNKGTAFTAEERERYNLEGLLPPVIDTIDFQQKRVLNHLDSKKTDIDRYIYLMGLLDRNETLFFRTLMSDPVRFVPIVYDPVVGQACLEFSEIYRNKAGMYISLKDKGNIKNVLKNWPEKNVRFICISTGGRILGLGDLGANGMGIPLGKLQLYTACAAIPPEGLLPLLLDCGTENETLLDDPFYIGVRQHRPSAEVLDELVEEFVEAVQELFPDCCIHFEDWKGTDAIRILARYKDKVCCYNDDIQGTAAVSLAGIMGALKIAESDLKDQRILLFGAGSAGIGISNMICKALQHEGLSEAEAVSRISLFDINGLIESGRTDLSDSQRLYAHQMQPTKVLTDAINAIKPTILIGVSTVGKAFTKDVLEAMAAHNAHPIVFALSNPTEHAECTAAEAYEWTDGKVIYAAGIPFDPVSYNGFTYYPGQANNYYCFPGVSLAIYATNPKLITDQFWVEAANALADQLTADEKAKRMVFPPQKDILEVSFNIAVRVAQYAFDSGLARVERPADIVSWIKNMQYKPDYPEL